MQSLNSIVIFFINNDLDSKNFERGIFRISANGGERSSVFLSNGIQYIDISPDGSKLMAYVRGGSTLNGPES